MSNLFDQSFVNAESTPVVCRALDAHITETYGENAYAAGHLALDAEGRIIDIRVYISGQHSDDHKTSDNETPHGDDMEAWNDMVEWLKGLGTTVTMTFFRRPHNEGRDVRPTAPDTNVFDATLNNAPLFDLDYRGHLITNGTQHGLMMDADSPEAGELLRNGPGPGGHIHTSSNLDGLGGLGALLDNETKAKLARKALAGAQAQDDVDPAIIANLEAAIRHYETGEPIDAVEFDKGKAALRRMEQKLNNSPRKSSDPFELPDTTERPDVPPAFYKN